MFVSRLNSPAYVPSYDPQQMDMSSGFGPRQGQEMCAAAMGLQRPLAISSRCGCTRRKLEMGEPSRALSIAEV